MTRKNEDEEVQDHVRQVSLTSMNKNVLLVSAFKEENTEFLIRSALKCLKELKKIDQGGG